MSKLTNSVVFSLPQVSVPDAFQAATAGRPYVDCGTDNLYPSYLADLITISTSHSAIMEAKIAFLNASLETNEDIDFKLDFDNIDGEGGTIEDFLSDIFTNLAMFNGGYVEVIYNKVKTRIVAVKSIPFEMVRVGKYNEEGVIDTIFLSYDWSRKHIKRNTPRTLDVFNPNNIKSNSQVMIVRTKMPNQPYYPIPGWVSSIQSILLEDDTIEYVRNAVLNGFTPSVIFNFHNGEPTEEDKAALEAYTKRKFTGKSSSKFMLFFDNDKDKSVDITTLDVPDLARYIESLVPILSDNIFTGHKIYPSLVGVPVSNGFSSNAEELNSQFQIYLKSTIIPLQKLVLTLFRKISLFNTGVADTKLVFINELISSEKDTVVAEDNNEDNVAQTSVEAPKEPLESTLEDSDTNTPLSKKKPSKVRNINPKTNHDDK